MAREFLVKLAADGKDPRGDTSGLTFDGLFAQWLERHAKTNKRSWQDDVWRYGANIKPLIGASVVSQLRRRDIIAALDEIADDVSPVTANRCQAIISAVFKWALDEDLIETNPAHGIRKRGQETQRERVMSDEESRAFWNALTDSPVDRVLRLLLILGQRRTEVAQAGTVELSATEWNIPATRTKNKLPHVVPLSPLALELFGDGFGLSETHPSERFKAIADKLRMQDIRLHDLRHCCATGMAKLGVPREIRERVQNQVTGQRQTIGSRYDQHDYANEKRRALQLWETRLLEIVENRPASGLRW